MTVPPSGGPWEFEQSVKYGGRLVTNVICPESSRRIGEVRVNMKWGLIFWYRPYAPASQTTERGPLGPYRGCVPLERFGTLHRSSVPLGCPSCRTAHEGLDLEALLKQASGDRLNRRPGAFCA